MSQVRLGLIWQHQLVLPYILNTLKAKLDAITPVREFYLYGSRSRTTVKDWAKLEGKDWDIIAVCNFPITNTKIWTTDLGYHIDLSVRTPEEMEKLKATNLSLIQLFPRFDLKEMNFNTDHNEKYI